MVSTDVPANLAWAKQFREIADASRTDSHDPPPRIIARIDDPWQAEYWRRTNAYRTPTGGRVESVRWVPDALSIYEVTATMLVTHVQSDAARPARRGRPIAVGAGHLCRARPA